jgi:hypothetical protein
MYQSARLAQETEESAAARSKHLIGFRETVARRSFLGLWFIALKYSRIYEITGLTGWRLREQSKASIMSERATTNVFGVSLAVVFAGMLILTAISY